MTRLIVSVWILVLAWSVGPICAEPTAEPTLVQGARVWTDPAKTRLVFETSAAVVHRVFPLGEPERLVVDLENVRMGTDLPKVDLGDALLVGLRGGVLGGSDVRIVLDLKQPVRAKSFALGPNERYGHRLVIDLTPKDGAVVRRVALPLLPDSVYGRGGGRAGMGRGQAVVVAIDAGHGGEDPGAIGTAGTREKDVTLGIARELAKLIDREPGLRSLLIRDGDYYVGLRERIELARTHRADLFVSIHADAFANAGARGSSVYTLSHGVASSEAATWLAERENGADRIGGVELATGDDLLATVLMDMTRNATMELSTHAAALVLANLGRLGTVHRADVQRAGFAVLKAPDVPSILVETAFISNPDDEQRLADRGHQRRLAEAILAGVRAYFRKYPAPGVPVEDAPRMAGGGADGGREYVIASGDTLSDIAKRHRVSIADLRARNGLTNDVIRVGQVLTIPGDS